MNHSPNSLLGTKNKQIKLVFMIRRKKKSLISSFSITTNQLEFANILMQAVRSNQPKSLFWLF